MDDLADGAGVVPESFTYPFNTREGIDVSDTYDEVRSLPELPKAQLLRGDPAWLVTRYEDARFVLGDLRFSRAAAEGRVMPGQADLPPNGAGLIGLDPPEHTRVRGVVARPFSVHEVERLDRGCANSCRTCWTGSRRPGRPPTSWRTSPPRSRSVSSRS